ncbi:MAG: hypothetical protein IPK75_20650 [Acidobacteria bacterium]|nr:hypothetical protein [Acidobacteriota bacterium]
MAGKPGRSGRPIGSVEKMFSDAVRVLVCQRGGDGEKRITVIANRLVSLAEEGNIVAIQEVANRLDGKPPQQVAVTGEDGGPLQIEIRQFFKQADDAEVN